MKQYIPLIISVTALLVSGLAINRANIPPSTEIVRQVVMKNPQMLVDSFVAFKTAQDELKFQQIHPVDWKVMGKPTGRILGNPNGSLTVVEFMDYQCSFCKAAEPELLEILKSNPNMRIVVKDFAILGPMSTIAAQAAKAAELQGKGLEFHNLMMAIKGQLKKEDIVEVAVKIGLDIPKFSTDANSEIIKKQVEDEIKLANSVEITGTPGFVVETGRILSGFGDRERFLKFAQQK